MLKNIFLLLTFFVFSTGTAQIQNWPCLIENKPERFTGHPWFLDSLKAKYTQFIVFTEWSSWSINGMSDAIAVNGNEAFIIKMTNCILDSVKIRELTLPLDQSTFKAINDTLISLNIFQLKDESQVPPCCSRRDTIIDGVECGTLLSTFNTMDGEETEIIIYAGGRSRYARYYELVESVEICPKLRDWEQALAVRNYLKKLFDKVKTNPLLTVKSKCRQ